MKRHGNLFEKICSLENLWLAEKKAKKGKKKQKGVIEHNKRRKQNILKLQEMLINKTYKTSPYKTFKIFDGKEREISVLPFIDRICHHAVINIIGPILTSTFTADTYSNIKGRGIHRAVYKLKAALKDKPNTTYCLTLDIKKYYHSVSNEILKRLLRKKFKDKDLLWLLDEIIDSAAGLPLGNLTSQTLANFYLTYFDHYIKEVLKVKHYFKYADDIVILHSSKEYLRNILNKIREYFKTLGLEIKHNWQIFPVASRGIDFLGYKFFHNYILLRKGIKKRFANMMQHNFSPTSKASYMGWASHCDSINLVKKLSKFETLQAA